MPDRRSIRLTAVAVTPIPGAGSPLVVRHDLAGVDAVGRVLLISGTIGPGVAALMTKCAGLICKSGGLTAHIPILAREMGLPCLIGVSEIHRLEGATLVALRPHESAVIGVWL
ncbi:PEP-utilizing enzyme [Actinoallomurus sp. CA-150999]|uniref:PEP-utilizing enzyme n=1 Tax=Actinoallomurus sp. CA-150999 TaxID=3239887 RepID=UPI003D9264D8